MALKLLCPCGRKRTARRPVCDRCWDGQYQIRAVTFPVLGPVGVLSRGGALTVPADRSGEHREMLDSFVAEVRRALEEGTDLANWAVRQLLHADATKTTGAELPPLAPLVPTLDQRYVAAGRPAGPLAAQSANAILRFAESHYRGNRRACIWDYRRNLPLKRFPAPFPVHNQSWRLCRHEQRPALSFRLHGEDDGPRWLIRLASGDHYRHQLRGFDWLLANGGDRPSDECPFRGQLDLYTQSIGRQERGNTRRGRKGRAREGLVIHDRWTTDSQRVPCVLMAKLVAYFPRPEAREATGELVLRADRESFLLGYHEDGEQAHPWFLNHDEMRRWFAEMRDRHLAHAAFLHRISQDQKLERRTHVGHHGQTNDARSKRCDKHNRRVVTWIKQVVAQIIGYCQRRHIGSIIYDDTDRRWLCDFPWSVVSGWLRNRCLATGIRPGGTLELAADMTGDDLPGAVASAEAVDYQETADSA